MKIKDLLLSTDQLALIEDVESSLLERKKKRSIAGHIAVILGILQVVLLVNEKGQELFNFGSQWKDNLTFFSNPLYLVFIILFILTVVYYFLSKYTGILLKESKEPFRYTFWIDGFEYFDAEKKASEDFKGADLLCNLLHRDLMEMLNQRITRFSILAKENENSDSGKTPESYRKSSHIQVHGLFAFRKGINGNWLIQVSPMVRIGPEDAPATLASPIRYSIAKSSEENPELNPSQYKQILERVYSRVSTEIYARIENDVKEKIKLFPTDFLKAQALGYEADDFAKSNTIDGYEKAILLYKESMGLFDKMGIQSHWVKRFLLLRWNSVFNYKNIRHAWALTVIGYAKCRVFRNQLAGQTGRNINPIHALPGILKPVLNKIRELYYKNNSGKKKKLDFVLRSLEIGKKYNSVFKNNIQKYDPVLIEIHLVSALTYYFITSFEEARSNLEWAEAIDPNQIAAYPTYHLVKGLLDPEPNMKLIHFQNAVELDRSFQMSHWFLANQLDTNFRRRGEITLDRAKLVIQAYDKIIEINAGNIASLGASANLYWLAGDKNMAKKILKEAIELKTITSETFIGELNYRLARIAAEEGNFLECRSRYFDAISTNPSLGAFSLAEYGGTNNSDYDFISTDMLLRFEEYGRNVSGKMEEIKKNHSANSVENIIPENVFKIAEAFVLNDLGNAYLRYFHHHGDQLMLLKAKELYESAEKKSPEIAAIWANLINVYDWLGEWEKIKLCYDNAKKIAPHWGILAIKSAPYITSAGSGKVREFQKLIDQDKKKLEEINVKVADIDFKLSEIEKKEKSPKKSSVFSLIQGTYPFHNYDPRLEGSNIHDNSESKRMEEERIHLLQKQDKLEEEKESLLKVSKEHKIEKEKVEKEARSLFNEAKEIIKRHSRLSSLMVDDDIELVNYFIQIPSEKLIEEDFLVMDALINILFNSDSEIDQNNVVKLCQRLLGIFNNHHSFLSTLNATLVKKIFLQIVTQLKIIGENQSEIKDAWKPDLDELTKETNYIFKNGIDQYKITILNKITDFLKAYTKKSKVAAETDSLNSPTLGESHNDMDRTLVDNFKSLNEILGQIQIADLSIKEKVKNLIGEFEKNREVILNIVSYWKEIDNGSFLSLFWYFNYRENQTKEGIDQIISKFGLTPESGIQNTLGNVYLRQFILNKGEEFLSQSIDFLKEAIRMNPYKPEYHANLGKAYFERSAWKDSVYYFREAVKSDINGLYKDILEKEFAKSVNRIGNQYYSNSEFEDAIDYWNYAIQLDKSQGVYFHNLSLGYEKINLGDNPEILDKTIEALEESATLDKNYHENLSLAQQLKRKMKLLASSGNEHLKMASIVTPIRVEHGSVLGKIFLDVSGNKLNEEVTRKQEELKSKIGSKFGISLPRIRFSINEYFNSENIFVVSFNEIPVFSNFLYPDKKLCIVTDENYAKYNNPVTAYNPFGKEKAIWLDRKDFSSGEVFSEATPLEYFFDYIESIITKNFTEILKLEDIGIKCEFHSNREIKELINSAKKLTDLYEICKALVAEQVPIVDFEEIVEFYLENLKVLRIEEIIESLRCRLPLKEKLPGISHLDQSATLGPNFESVIQSNIRFLGEFHFLAIGPQQCQDLLNTFKNSCMALDPKVIIVNNPKIRIHVKKLIELEFPEIHVLAHREILGDYTVQPERVIEYLE